MKYTLTLEFDSDNEYDDIDVNMKQIVAIREWQVLNGVKYAHIITSFLNELLDDSYEAWVKGIGFYDQDIDRLIRRLHETAENLQYRKNELNVV